MARQSFHQSMQERGGERIRSRTEERGTAAFPEFDPLIHERIRLGIISALATNESLSFNDLKRLLQTTDGNGFEGRIPRSNYRLTARGRKALARYLEQMEELIRRTKE